MYRVNRFVIIFTLLLITSCSTLKNSEIITTPTRVTTSTPVNINSKPTQTPNITTVVAEPSPTPIIKIDGFKSLNCNEVYWIWEKDINWLDSGGNDGLEEINIEIPDSKTKDGITYFSANGEEHNITEGGIVSFVVQPLNSGDYVIQYSPLHNKWVRAEFTDLTNDSLHTFYVSQIMVDETGNTAAVKYPSENFCYDIYLQPVGLQCNIDSFQDGSMFGWGKDEKGNIICPIVN